MTTLLPDPTPIPHHFRKKEQFVLERGFSSKSDRKKATRMVSRFCQEFPTRSSDSVEGI
jgi:hypothetical protein